MSLKSWKQEFYPRSAELCCKTALEALEASLLKYEGCLQENLRKHNVILKEGTVFNEGSKFLIYEVRVDKNNYFRFTTQNCALCHWEEFQCETCLIYGACSMLGDEWVAFASHSNPQPMIDRLRLTIMEKEDEYI